MTQYIFKDNLNLAYEIHGEGHPIICLPGLTRTMEDFDPFVESFKPKAQIITLSYRGRKPSDNDPQWQNYNIVQECEDVISLLDHLKIEKALWLGTSRGGLITIYASNNHMDRMAASVLNDIGPEIQRDGIARILDYLGKKPEFKTQSEAAQILSKANADRFLGLSKNDWAQIAQRWYRFDDRGAHLKYDRKLRDAMLSPQPEIDFWAGFDRLASKPLGLIWGENSDLIGEEIVEKMQTRQASMKLATVPDRGHVPFLDEKEALHLIETVFKEGFDV